MDVQPVHNCPRESVDRLLSSVPFYKLVKQVDQYQYELLLQHSRIIEYQPGEVVLEKGEREEWLYFLLKGQLEVKSGEADSSDTVVNFITPGEVFGGLAVLFDHVRIATVVADSNSRKVLVFGTNVKIFGKLEEIHNISLSTKLIYYRNMVHNLRWRLEMYRVAYPDQEFSSAHRQIKVYSGPKDTLSELRDLDNQARELAKLLVIWNSEYSRLSINQRADLDSASLRALG